MAEKPILSQELKGLLDNVKENIVQEFPIQVITPNYLILSMLDVHECDGYSVVSKLMLESAISDFRDFVVERILKDSSESIQQDGSPRFSDEYDRMVDGLSESGHSTITSSLMLYSIVTSDEGLMGFLSSNGVTMEQLRDVVVAYSNSAQFRHSQTGRRKAKRKESKPSQGPAREVAVRYRVVPDELNLAESGGVNLVRNAENGDYDGIIGFDGIVSRMFAVLGKCDRNVVALTGEHGVGRTSAVHRMALLMYRQDCPREFMDKYVIQFDDTVSTKTISDMDKSGKYVAFIDDIEKFFINKDTVPTNVFLLSELFKKRNVPTVVSMTDAFYSKQIETNPSLARYVQRINIDEPSDADTLEILAAASPRFANAHGVEYSEAALEESVRLARRFVSNERCPKSALNILDMAGSCVRLSEPIDPAISAVKSALSRIASEKSDIRASGTADDFDRMDSLVKDEMKLNAELYKLIKDSDSGNPLSVTPNDVRSAASVMFGIPLEDLSSDDRERLKSLKERISADVIGQDAAVDEVCRAVRRQRVGISDPTRPVVLMFVGQSGVGKSFLAKQLAKQVFGDENNMVRLDMSEYSDITSVTKLYGSSAGYVGYEEGGVLTEALKRKPRCVLLLDEIEKAHDDVFNVFLQVFDEGRLTDNKGNTVSFRNVIVIMTSNIGTREVSENASRIGFGTVDRGSDDRNIIMNAIKRKFRPEFINRIDSICCFNGLGESDIRTIIEHEISKTDSRLSAIGYSLGDDILHGKFVDDILEAVRTESEYGARPVRREVMKRLDDRLTDLIIDGGVEEGHVFTYNDIYMENDN